jgi:hypothetical protein
MLRARLAKLQTIWPREPCAACRARPAIRCVPDAETPAPRYPEGVCRRCGRQRFTVPILVGVDCHAM